jgi:apolipoprotein N-acyltransferase
LNFPDDSKIRRLRFIVAAIAGTALALAFPDFYLAGLAWVAPGLFVAAAHGNSGGRAFRIGYVGGLVFQLVTLRWLLNIPVTGFPILGWIALSAFLALFQATWVWLVSRMQSRLANSGSSHSFAAQQAAALAGAAAWVALEMIQARLFSGFPWHLLGASQFQMTPLMQIASVTGIYGVSFMAVWAALSLWAAFRVLMEKPASRYAWLGQVALPLLATLALFITGMSRVREADAAGNGSLRVAFIQPNIPQTMIWNSAHNTQRFSELMRWTESALTNKPELILWPEAALPVMLRYDETVANAITGFARSNRVWMIIGSDDAEPGKHPARTDDADYFNASFLISPEGEIAGRYAKRNLVMFGEYIPLARWLPFVKWFTPIEGGFTAGDRVETFAMPQIGDRAGSLVNASVLICFEDVFPHHVRAHVNQDSDFLVNLTNDGWFGEGAEQWQHAATAAFRTVENGVPLLRSCNNGVTCWIDARGRFRQVLSDEGGNIHSAGVMIADVPLRESEARTGRTFYNRHGDVFGWACIAITGLMIIRTRSGRHNGTVDSGER